MTDREILTRIFNYQIKRNILVSGVDWRDADWRRYLWLECAEVLDHLPWKNIWWNKQINSESMLKIEIIDVFIFGISLMLSLNLDTYLDEDFAWLAGKLLGVKPINLPKFSMENRVENIARMALQHDTFDTVSFVALLEELKIDVNELYRYYLGKHTLVQLRYDYMPDYSKQWGTACTDNSYLASVLNSNMEFQEVDETFEQRLYNLLESSYLGLKDL